MMLGRPPWFVLLIKENSACRDIEKAQPVTQLIAHDREVFDISFSHSPDLFASVGADGSLRMFDLRYMRCFFFFPSTNRMGTEIWSIPPFSSKRQTTYLFYG